MIQVNFIYFHIHFIFKRTIFLFRFWISKYLTLNWWFFFVVGWLDDQLFISRDGDKADVRGSVRRNVVWNNFSGNHAFTTGRQRNDNSFGNKIRPKGPSQTLKVSFFYILLNVIVVIKYKFLIVKHFLI